MDVISETKQFLWLISANVWWNRSDLVGLDSFFTYNFKIAFCI